MTKSYRRNSRSESGAQRSTEISIPVVPHRSVTFNVELVELVNGDLEVVVKVVEVQKEVWKRAR